jgi:hypothetical protein
MDTVQKHNIRINIPPSQTFKKSKVLWLYSLLDLGRFWIPNPIHNRQDYLEGGTARRKAATYT